jgi:hypothetical protein
MTVHAPKSFFGEIGYLAIQLIPFSGTDPDHNLTPTAELTSLNSSSTTSRTRLELRHRH